jgi:hypothetical protein
MDETISATWEELNALQLETASLLQMARKKTPKKPKPGGESPLKPKLGSQTPTMRKKRAKGSARKGLVSQSLDTGMDTTLNLFGPDSVKKRLTLEVYDDASPDVSPRLGEDLYKEGALEVLKKESAFRAVAFNDEKARVAKRDDTFVPTPGINQAIEHVKAERERLHQLEQTARMAYIEQIQLEKDRSAFGEKDGAALKLQSLARGNIGRQKFALTRKLSDVGMLDRSEGIKSDWIEVRDRESGDMWFYNRASGISQWDRPVEMLQSLASPSSTKTLPSLQTATAAASGKTKNKKAQFSPGAGLPAIDSAMDTTADFGRDNGDFEDAYGEDSPDPVAVHRQEEQAMRRAEQEIHSELGLDKLTPFDSLFSPDGAFKPKLRNTIQDALVQTRFDNVSTVLQDKRWAEDEVGPYEHPPAPGLGVTEKKDLTRIPMVAQPKPNAVGIKKKKKEVFRVSNDGSKNSPTKTVKDMTMGHAGHPGFEGSVSGKRDNMCFGCWSCGDSKSCNIHAGDMPIKKTETMVLCRNWSLDVMRRRYRSEEMQEVFLKRAQSLKFDNKRKKFNMVVEDRHQIYRSVKSYVNLFNFRSVIVKKAQRWIKSILDEVRGGRVDVSRRPKVAETTRIMRLKRSMLQGRVVSRYSTGVRPFQPIGPTTGYSHSERVGEIQFLFTKYDPSTKADVELINVFPHPCPVKLYTARKRFLPAPRQIPLPKAAYNRSETSSIFPTNSTIPDDSPAAWYEQMCHSLIKSSYEQAMDQVKMITPPEGLELIRKTKYCDPSSIKLATLGRKPVAGMVEVRGLPMEILGMQIISTYVPAQYGGFMVMDKAAVSPGVSPEDNITFHSIEMGPMSTEYVHRGLEHALTQRRAPCAAISSKVLPGDKHFLGTNNSAQTGEQEHHGFRTTIWGRYLTTNMEVIAHAFTPGAEIVALNLPGANVAVTTHADLNYPFCEPASKDNTTLDFYFLLLEGTVSASLAQVFTALTVQEPGPFMKDGNPDAPLGHLVVAVYRSWAFKQKDTIEHFKTDDGVDYWYHRRTGQTFWEYPKCDEEKEMIREGGTLVDREHHEEPMTVSRGKEGQKPRYDQGKFRNLMLEKHEEDNDAIKRRGIALASAKVRGDKLRQKKTEEEVKAMQDRQNGDIDDDNDSGGGDVASSVVGGGLSRSQVDALPDASATADRVGTEDSASSRDSNVGTHFSGESSLRNDGGKRKDLRAPGERSMESLDKSKAGDNTAFDDFEFVNPLEEEGKVVKKEVPQEVTQNLKDHPLLANMEMDQVMDMSKHIGTMMSNISLEHAETPDLIGLGLQMGMSLIGNGMLSPEEMARKKRREAIARGEISEHEAASKGDGFFPTLAEADFDTDGNVDPSLVLDRAKDNRKHPIDAPARGGTGAFNPNPTELDHVAEDIDAHRMDKMVDKKLTALEEALATKIVTKVSLPPDEQTEKIFCIEKPKNAEEGVKGKFPLLVYPHLSTETLGGAPDEVTLHGPAGKGDTWVGLEDGQEDEGVPGAPPGVRKAVVPLPAGFFNNIAARRICSSDVDYLPQVPNLPQCRNVGRVKPRNISLDWLAIGFDPWSAGKSPLNVEFVGNLSSKAESLFPEKAPIDAHIELEALHDQSSKDVYLTVEDTQGILEQKESVNKTAMIEKDFQTVSSLCRHGKYADVEELMNGSDWNVPIDYQDGAGNALIHIAAQNGSKRLVKMCIRRGCNVDIQNLMGQTGLHFAFGYGYDDLGNYMVSKGANDAIMNGDKLTCYEGLGAAELALL